MRIWLWRNKFRIIFGLVIVGVGGYLALMVASSYYLEAQFFAQIEAARAMNNKHLPAILADLKLLDQNPIFPQSARARDAQAFLSRHISWYGKNPTSQELDRQLKEKYPQIGKSPEQFRALMRDASFLARYETSWLEEVRGFDHFDILSRPEAAQELSQLASEACIDRMSTVLSLPWPSYSELRSWAIVHLVKSHLQGRTREGLRTLRKVAELIDSTYTLVGAIVSSELLFSERVFTEEFAIKDWKAVPKGSILAYRRVSRAWGALVHSPSLANLPAEFASYLTPRHGLCYGVMEAKGGIFLTLQDLLEPRVPFESDLSREIGEARQVQGKYFDLCKMQAFSGLLSPPPEKARPWIFKGEEEHGYQINGARIPFKRRAVAFILMSIAFPNYMRLYDEPENQND